MLLVAGLTTLIIFRLKNRNVDETTAYGLKIERNKIKGLPSLDDHNKALSIFIDECVNRGLKEKDVLDVLKKLTVQWWDYKYTNSQGINMTVVKYYDGYYSGATVGNLSMVAWRGSIAASAFHHEIMHPVGRKLLNDEDPDHNNDFMWNIVSACKARCSVIGI